MRTSFVVAMLVSHAIPWAVVTQRAPVVIEALRDVQVIKENSDGTSGQHRGVLYSHDTLHIAKSTRFTMIKELGEGECRVRVKERELELSSCPWLPGFTDHQSDIFRVIPARAKREELPTN
ncbi:MAG: hypothetical protein ABJB74_01950 [Gemmatimonas sp.]